MSDGFLSLLHSHNKRKTSARNQKGLFKLLLLMFDILFRLFLFNDIIKENIKKCKRCICSEDGGSALKKAFLLSVILQERRTFAATR